MTAERINSSGKIAVSTSEY